MKNEISTTPNFKRRRLTPTMWASGSTFVLHGAFLLAVWLWPKTPPKPEEKLLVVDLTKDETAPKPTARPTTPAQPTPPPTPAPRVNEPTPPPLPTPLPLPTSAPKLVLKPRVAKLQIPKIEVPTPIPRKMPPSVTKRELTPTEPKPKARTNEPLAKLPVNPLPVPSVPDSPKTAAQPLARRRFARNTDEPTGSRSTRPPEENSARRNNIRKPEAAGGEINGLSLPRTRTRRGRSGEDNNPFGESSSGNSAPGSSAKGTETQVDIGPSVPNSKGGNRRLADAGSGSENLLSENGLARAGLGSTSSGLGGKSRGQVRRGDGESAGEVGGRGTGNGPGGSSGRGRRGSRVARGDGGGDGGFGDGKNGSGGGSKGGDYGNGKGDGTPGGPSGGTRLAKRGNGGGDGGDGDGNFGRGGGLGDGKGNGNGDGPGGGKGGRGGVGDGPGGGRGGESAEGAGGTRARVRRVREGARRGAETENEIGRGIWGGFKIRFYQDKADHPDQPDGTFFPGNPIDWPVFTKLSAQKTVPNLDFDWGEQPPAAGMRHTFWSLKANGRIFVPKDDNYEFFFDELDDAGSLVLDGKEIIKVWKVQKSSPSSASLFLKRGPHDIGIEYVQGPATAASIKLSWRSTSFPKEIVGVYQAPGE